MKKILTLLSLFICLVSCSNDLDNNIEPEVKDTELKTKSSVANLNIGHDWSGLIEGIIVTKAVVGQHNEVTVSVPSDYVVVGGGASINISSPMGALLTGSYPNSQLTGWTATSKDHIKKQMHTLNVYAIGIKINGLSSTELKKNMTLTSNSVTGKERVRTNSQTYINKENYIVIGGGAKTTQISGDGIMLKVSNSTTNGWTAQASDHRYPSYGILTTYAIGINKILPIVGEIETKHKQSYFYSPYYTGKFTGNIDVDYGWLLTSIGGATYGEDGVGRLLYSMIPNFSTVSVTSTDHISKDYSIQVYPSLVQIQKKKN